MRLGWIGTYVRTQHDDFDDVEGQGSIPIIHDQDLTITEARLALDVGLTRRFAASLMLPVRLISTNIRYLDGSGDSVDLVTPSAHHRNETLTGLADPMLLGAGTEAWGGFRLTVRAGLSIPLGRTEEDPFVNPEMSHQHIQMGTGTVNPVLALEAAYGWNRWRVAGFGFTQQIVYENSKGYHAGDRYAAGVAVRRALGKWSVRGGAEIQAETYEAWNGIRYTEEGNQGRFDAMIATGASWAATDRLTFDASLKIPFINHVVGGQLDVPALLEIGAAWTFGAPAMKGTEAEEDHDHDHDHADEHGHEGEHGHDEHGHDEHADAHGAKGHALDTTGADVKDLGPPGARQDLVPVAGKLTIFDFWATWCEPCKTLDPALVELAKKYPDRVAVRRIDVVDWDSAVVAQHLTAGGFDLPHLKIYDARGKLVLEDSSGPGKLMKLIETVRALVETHAGGTVPATTPPAGDPTTPTPGDATAPVTPTPTPAPAKPVAPKPAPKRFAITVTDKGFVPATVTLPRGVPVVLEFQRKAEKTCATEVIFEHDGKRVMRELPLRKTVSIPLTFRRAGTITYACAMNMIKGTLVVR